MSDDIAKRLRKLLWECDQPGCHNPALRRWPSSLLVCLDHDSNDEGGDAELTDEFVAPLVLGAAERIEKLEAALRPFVACGDLSAEDDDEARCENCTGCDAWRALGGE